MTRAAQLLTVALAGEAAAAWPRGPYATTSATLPVPGLQQGTQQALAYWPSGAAEGELFPLVSWSHGDVAAGPIEKMSYNTLLDTLASYGLVVLAHQSCFPSCGDTQYLDMLRVLDFAAGAHANGTAAAPPLSLVNYSAPFGVSGHSTGGRSSLQACQDDVASAHRVGAAVCFNPDPKEDAAQHCHRTPVAIWTGTKDWIEPKGSARADFDALPADNKEKVFAEVVGTGHLDPIDLCLPSGYPGAPCAKMAPYAAAFFRLHLAGDDAARPLLYGHGDHGLCSNTTYKMAQCVIPQQQ